MDFRGTFTHNSGGPTHSKPHLRVRNWPVDNHCDPNAPTSAKGKNIQANSIKVKISLTQMAQSTFSKHHPRSMVSLGRDSALYSAFHTWKSMERHRKSPLRTHRQLGQKPFLFNCETSTTQT